MTIPYYIAIVFIGWPKLPYAFIRNFIVVLACSIPAGGKRACRRLELLVRNQVDGAVGIDVMIGAAGNAAQTQIRTGIGFGSVNGILAHKVMVGAQNISISAAKDIAAHFLSFRREDQEELVQRWGPVIGFHRERNFPLDIRLLQLVACWIRSCIYPGTTQYRISGASAFRIGVLPVVVIEGRTSDTVKVLQDQAMESHLLSRGWKGCTHISEAEQKPSAVEVMCAGTFCLFYCTIGKAINELRKGITASYWLDALAMTWYYGYDIWRGLKSFK